MTLLSCDNGTHSTLRSRSVNKSVHVGSNISEKMPDSELCLKYMRTNTQAYGTSLSSHNT